MLNMNGTKKKDELKLPECFICKTTKTRRILIKNKCNIWECSNCKLLFVDPQLDIFELKKIYSKEAKYARRKTKLEKVNFSKSFLQRIDYLALNNKKKLLDVGCGMGDFIYLANKKGLEAEGVELNKNLAAIGLKESLNIFIGELSSAKYPKEYFDAIHLGDIIEHVKKPRELLGMCSKLLKKGGVLIVSTPNTNSFFPIATYKLFQYFKIPWSHPTPPQHLFEFSDKNLIQLLKQEKFCIKKIIYSKVELIYSIYKTGLFDEICDRIKNKNKRNFLMILLKNYTRKIPIFLATSILYSTIYTFLIIISMFSNKNDQMVVYCTKNND